VQTQAEAGYATIATADSVTKTGAGTLVFDAANAYTGPTTVSAGTLLVSNGSAVASSAVTVATGGTLALPTDGRVSVSAAGLAVDQAPGGGLVDLGPGQLVVAAGGISAADLRADIIAGRNGGGWNGTAGITSSAAATAGGARAVGYVIAGDGTATVSFAAPGDTDLNGAVNVFDLVTVNSSGKYGTGSAAVWSQGDSNYDGVTNVFDLVGINGSGAYGQGNYFPAAPSVGSVAAVPEPGFLGAGAAAILAGMLAVRRRRPAA
jgi:autotransporter-associated beta strand protein